jgi:hypothetical protein
MKGLLATVAAIALVCLAAAAPAQMGMVSPVSLGLHGGSMISPRGALLVGGDAALPGTSLLPGFKGRLDVDVITKANFGGINTIVPVTLSQVLYAPRAGGFTTTYFGGGVGAILGGKAVFDAKLLLGMDLTQRVGAEANLHFTEHDTLLTVYARIKL